jgi:hypothetical protein
LSTSAKPISSTHRTAPRSESDFDHRPLRWKGIHPEKDGSQGYACACWGCWVREFVIRKAGAWQRPWLQSKAPAHFLTVWQASTQGVVTSVIWRNLLFLSSPHPPQAPTPPWSPPDVLGPKGEGPKGGFCQSA